jgi:hypothetical protein
MRKKTSAQLKKQLWKIFSEWVRRNGAARDGYNVCFTCGVHKHWKQLHAGHYIRASAGLATYFLEENVHPQCYACNIWRDGNSDSYALKLIEKYGDNILVELNKIKGTIIKDYPFEKEIEKYQDKLKTL